MKRKSFKLLLCSALMVIALAVSACGDKKDNQENADNTPTKEATDDSKKEDDSANDPSDTNNEGRIEDAKDDAEPDDTVEPDAAGEDDTTDTPLTEKFASVQEFAESDLVQGQLEELKTALADSGMDIAITGEGDKLIYTYTIQSVTKSDELTEQFKSALAVQTETFTTIAASLREAVEVEAPVVVVTYVDMNGDVIYSEEFAAE